MKRPLPVTPVVVTPAVPSDVADVQIALRLANRARRLIDLTALEVGNDSALLQTERSLLSQAAAAWLARYPVPKE